MYKVRKIEDSLLKNGGLHFKIIPREFKLIVEYMI